jgi:hypothetical protein
MVIKKAAPSPSPVGQELPGIDDILAKELGREMGGHGGGCHAPNYANGKQPQPPMELIKKIQPSPRHDMSLSPGKIATR